MICFIKGTAPGCDIFSNVGTIVPSGIQIGAGVKAGSVYRIHTQGTLAVTGNELDLAMDGKGWMQIELPNGDTAYTRDGSFRLSPDGEIITAEGYLSSPGDNNS